MGGAGGEGRGGEDGETVTCEDEIETVTTRHKLVIKEASHSFRCRLAVRYADKRCFNINGFHERTSS